MGRNLAAGRSWLGAFFTGLALVLMPSRALTGSANWSASEHPATGAEVSRMIAMVVVGLPVFIWQFRVLRSDGIRRLTQAAAEGAS